MSARELDRNLVEHAREQLGAAARRHVRGGMGPASAARVAIRETQALFPPGWRLGVRGDDDEEFVEVWEVEHKYAAPIATVRGSELERPAKLTASQRDALGAMIRRPHRERSSFPTAARRALGKLVERRLATAYGDRYNATEAGEAAYFAAQEQA
jgi:hypothetical protein